MPMIVILSASEREKFGEHCAFLKLYSEPSSLAINRHNKYRAMCLHAVQ